MHRRVLRLLVALSVLAALVPAGAVNAKPAREEPAASTADEGVGSANMKHVANIAYERRYGAPPNQGTDLEFIEITLSGDAVNELAKREGENVTDNNLELPGIQRLYSVAGSYNNGMHMVDITKPDDTFVAGVYDCGISQGDVQVFTRDGRTYATYTWDDGYSAKTASACFTESRELGFSPSPGTFIADISNPYAPFTVSFVPVAKGSHNQTVHPSGNFLYNSNSDLITSVANPLLNDKPEPGIEVYDIRNFKAPELTAFLELPVRPGLGTESHDITFNEEGTRAYSAALSQGVIIDTTNPADPEIITSFLDPAINVWHQADPITIEHPQLGARDFLVVEDEVAGATGTGQCPNGGVHVYDITGPLELAPVKVGYWNIDQARAFSVNLSCTAHVFDLHEDEALMTIAYYQGGVHVVDLSNLVGVALGQNGVGMKELAYYYFPDEGAVTGGVDEGASDTWSFKAPFVDRDGAFYAYGNDQNRGFDVYHVDLSDPALASDSPGVWMTPAEALEMAQARPAWVQTAKPFCLLKS